MAVLLAALVAAAVHAAEASIPPPESWPSLVEEPAASMLEPPSLEDLAAELAAPAPPPAPTAAAAAGQSFRLFEGLELGPARRSEPRFRLYPGLETRVRAFTLPEPLHIELELPLTPSRFRLYGAPPPRIAVGGTFITTDPLGYVDGPNLLAYAGNNPVNFSDPLGLCKGEPGDPEECVSWWPYFPPGVIAEAQRNAEAWANDPEVGALDRASWQAQALVLGFGADFEEMGRRFLNLPHHKYSEHERWEAQQQRFEELKAELGCGRICSGEKRKQLFEAMVTEGLLGDVQGPGLAEIPIGPGRFKPRVSRAALETARQGGKHAGFLRNYAGRSRQEIERSIVSIEKQVAEHQAKIADPERFIPNFRQLDPRQQEALLTKKWPGDIQRQQEQLEILRGLLDDLQ